MSDRSYTIYLDDILSAMDAIANYTKNMDVTGFENNQLVIDAVIRNLEVIGEAAKKVPENIRSQAKNVEWRKMAGLRDRMIHDYMNVDLRIIWDIITINLPQTRSGIAALRNATK